MARVRGCGLPVPRGERQVRGTDETILPPYWIKNIKGAKIGFIGMTLKDTPNIVTASGIEGLDFTDEVETANALSRAQGAGRQRRSSCSSTRAASPSQQTWTDPATGTIHSVNANYDSTCEKGGALTRPARSSTSPAGSTRPSTWSSRGHTHAPYVCNIPDPAGQQRMVTSASSFGRLVTEHDLRLRPAHPGHRPPSVESSQRHRRPHQRQGRRRSRASSATTRRWSRPIANRVLGTITTDVTDTANAGSVNLRASPSSATSSPTPSWPTRRR